jgi:UPF0755 protein
MRFLAGFFAFLFIFCLIAGGATVYVMQQLEGPGPLTVAKTVIIPRGSSVPMIARDMEEEGVVSSRFLFRFNHFLKNRPPLKAGEYAFLPSIRMADVIDRIARGDVVKRRFTVPEGWTSYDVVKMLEAETALTGTVTQIPPEGSLLPDTYLFTYGDERTGHIAHMQKRMEEAVAEAWALRDPDLPLSTPHELVVLASIVEKETGLPEERARIAGVYLNRLRKNMILQSDPTVIYGLTLGKGPLGRLLTLDDLRSNSIYNTYVVTGLPPTPIANPGRAALMAAAKPEKNDFLFFVADGTGGHRFAATMEEHAKNVAYWRQVQQQQKK